MAAVGIVRRTIHIRCDDIRIALLIMLGKTVSRALGRSCFQVVQISILLLVI